MTELYIENQKADITSDVAALITYAIDDIKDFASRQTDFSKTIVLPGTATNNKIFGSIFEVGNGNFYNDGLPNIGYNFNASKSASCIIFQDSIQTFNGVIRLLQVNKEGKNIEYETSVFGNLFSLNVALSGALLEDLDFSEHDAVFDEDAVVNSWDNTPGSGVYYPLMDCGTYSVNKHDWDIKTFRPALYVKEYIDKIFSAAGFEYESDLFETERFKRLIIPHNKKRVLVLTTPNFNAYRNTSQTIVSGATTVGYIIFTSFSDVGFSIDGGGTTITYDSSTTASFNISLSYSIQLVNSLPTTTQSFYIDIMRNSDVISTQFYTIPLGSFVENRIVNVSATLAQDDTLFIRVRKDSASGSVGATILNAWFTGSTTASTYNEIEVGNTVNVNSTIPKNIRQVDFLLSIVKLFNLYIYSDKFNEKLFYIRPYIDFYGTGTVDWTYKLNRDKRVAIKPMSELNSKWYRFNYKDDSDYYTDLYKKRYGETYGSYSFDTEYEFETQENKLELIFAPTPLVGYAGEDKVYSTVFKRTGDASPVEETVDSVIRILQTKKITGVTSWNIKDELSVLASVTSYGYAGHFDDPDSPSNDLNFGALKEFFFAVSSGDFSATQFNIYWSSYMAEITDKDSKLLTGTFYLQPTDIYNLDFSNYVYLDGVLFRLNKISDYNASSPSDCEVELLKVNYTTY